MYTDEDPLNRPHIPFSSSFSMSRYRYSPLSLGANSIRLFPLLPYGNADADADKAELESELFEYPLLEIGKRSDLYEALSYSWGGQEKPHFVTIKQHHLSFTTNLYLALLNLRDRFLERIIWIDAICIDQENLDERSQQVQIMAMIYSRAHRVIVWLGDVSDDTEGALENIQYAAIDRPAKNSNRQIDQSAVSNLLRREWFQRIWVRE